MTPIDAPSYHLITLATMHILSSSITLLALLLPIQSAKYPIFVFHVVAIALLNQMIVVSHRLLDEIDEIGIFVAATEHSLANSAAGGAKSNLAPVAAALR